jgi:hypothetical protein
MSRVGDRTMDFESWRAAAAAELGRVHGIDATSVAERVWRNLYVKNYSPRAAADRAEVLYVNALPATERIRYRIIPRAGRI